jgi:uncharacterized protein
MTTRDRAPDGAPCWADLWTSDVEGSRRFYAEVFGWEAQAPSPEFGGYFMFTRDGVPVAGGMGPMGGDMPPSNSWKPYLAVDDAAKTLESAQSHGATVVAPAMPVADLGTQGVLVDPTGAAIGIWQPGSFHGFSVLEEPGAPSWFELHTRDYDRALEFYRSVFGWSTAGLPGDQEFRYATVQDPGSDGQLAGVLDASGILPEGVPSQWHIYWGVDGVDDTVRAAQSLGATLDSGPDDTPYGRLATLRDPAGATFKLRGWK